ncbi:Probable multidrug resistance-associated protein lethal(2)03659 [Gryllus bimaculatus]|nr:Probable multidrug resistance-associated protein lethal(2)03659 [Gryllus bimaculatus]
MYGVEPEDSTNGDLRVNAVLYLYVYTVKKEAMSSPPPTPGSGGDPLPTISLAVDQQQQQQQQQPAPDPAARRPLPRPHPALTPTPPLARRSLRPAPPPRGGGAALPPVEETAPAQRPPPPKRRPPPPTAMEEALALRERRRQLVQRQSSVWTRRQHAICVRRAHKRYGTKDQPLVILDGLNMTVPKGVIYGLLGASGCGKTTLLSCIVGRRRLDSGEIWVLGGRPGSRGSGVPGPRIGYMPQDLALYQEFTIRETLLYFGWVNFMTTKEIDRRVSFAAALIHDPELLILDEPTVGVDPLLRQNIWDHLVQITKGGNKTVIITTHYIDETRQAHTIALMRGGKFLAEESPTDLLRTHNSDSLEEVFLKLSKIQNIGKRRRSSFMQEVMSDVQTPGERTDIPPEEDQPVTCSERMKIISPQKMKALLYKNFFLLAIIALLPIFETALYCLAIGPDPQNLHIAIANYELNDTLDECVDSHGCFDGILSCRYLQHLRKRPFILDKYASEDDALYAVKRGHAWAALTFAANYSDSLFERMADGRAASPEAVDFGSVQVTMDMSNQHIGQMMKKDMLLTFQDFAGDILTSCNYSAQAANVPIRFNTPVFGSINPNFRDFAAPGVILTIIFFLCLGQTGLTMMIERTDGMLERCLVSGITPVEILMSHVIVQFCLMVLQVAAVLVFSFPIFGVPNSGSVFWLTVLCLLTGFCGMCYGFFISIFCDSERSASYIGLGSFVPVVMLCGIIWPVEGMHYILRYLSVVMPLTQTVESLRTIITRGKGMDVPIVYHGYISIFVWITIFLGASVLTLKFKKG